MAFGLQQSVFPVRIGEILLLVIALSMLLTPLAFIASDWIGAPGQDAPPRMARPTRSTNRPRSSSRASGGSGRW
jgi:hypothetical protein